MNEKMIKTLIPQAVAGDHNAYTEIYEMTKNYVYRTAYFLLEDKNDVDDAVQEVYFQLFKSLESFEPSLIFRPWLTGITIKQISEVRRKKRRISRLIQKLFKPEPANNEDILDKVIETESYQQIYKKIEKLSPKLKEVILLKYVHDFSQEEIAQLLGIPVGTVKSRINSALTKLRERNRFSSISTIKEGKMHGF